MMNRKSSERVEPLSFCASYSKPAERLVIFLIIVRKNEMEMYEMNKNIAQNDCNKKVTKT